MLSGVREQFLKRSQRDQMMILLLSIVLLGYLSWLVVIKPSGQAVEQERLQLSAMEESFLRVRRLAEQVKSLDSAAPTTSVDDSSLAQRVDASLRRNSIAIQGLQSGANGDVRLRVQNVDYSSFLHWLYDMEVEQGVQIVNLSIVSGEQEGRIIANVQLRQVG